MSNKAESTNSLSQSEPVLAAQWHPTRNGSLRPEEVTRRNGKKVWWKCDKGHEWQAIVAHRTAGSGCPHCSGRLASPTNNIAVSNPAAAKQWHPTKNGNLRPENVTPRTSKQVWWHCPKGHEWQAIVRHRNEGSGCPYCSGRLATKENNFASKFPDAARLWHPSKNGELAPTDITPRASKKVWWQCSEGHEWEAAVSNVSQARGCPVCMNKIIVDDNSLATLHPKIAKEWNYKRNKHLTPESIGSGSGKKVWWICEKGHEWKATVVSRTTLSTQCQSCTGRIPTKENNLAVQHPEAAKEWHPTKNRKLRPDHLDRLRRVGCSGVGRTW